MTHNPYHLAAGARETITTLAKQLGCDDSPATVLRAALAFAKQNIAADGTLTLPALSRHPTPPVPEPEAEGEAVAPVMWQWRSRFKGGAWDAWERGRFNQEVPPFAEVEERALYTRPSSEAEIADFRAKLAVANEKAAILDEISLVLETAGYAHMTNGSGIAAILSDLSNAETKELK